MFPRGLRHARVSLPFGSSAVEDFCYIGQLPALLLNLLLDSVDGVDATYGVLHYLLHHLLFHVVIRSCYAVLLGVDRGAGLSSLAFSWSS